MASKAIKGITIELGGNSTKLDQALEAPRKKARDLQAELRQIDKLLKFDPKNTELLAQKQKLLAEAIATTKDKLTLLKEAEKQVQEQFKRGEVSEEAYREVQRQVIATEQELKRLEDQAKKSNITLAQVANAADKIGDAAISMGKKFLPLTGVIAGAATASVKFGSDFNDSMAAASTLIDTTIYDMDNLKDKVLEISDKTGVAADQLGASMYDALSSGVELGKDGADMMAFLEKNTRLAKVGFTSIDTAVSSTAKTLNAYGYDVSETDRVHRILLKTQDLGIATVDELGQHLAKVTPTAAAMRVSFEQVGASLAVMTARGTPAAQATTQLNSLITELGKEGTKSSTILREKTGKSFKELMEAGNTLTDVLVLMQGELGGNTDAVMVLMSEVDSATGQTKSFEQACAELGLSSTNVEGELIDMFGSIEAGKAALSLGGKNAADFEAALSTMSDEADVVGEAFEKLETDSHKMQVALNQLKNIGITLGQTILTMLQPAIQKVGDTVNKASEWFKNLSDKQKETIVTVAAIIAAIGPALITFGKVSKGVASIINIGKKVGPLLTAIKTGASALFSTILANPVILVIAAIIAAVVLLYTKCEWFRDMVNGAFATIKAAISQAIEASKPAIESLMKSFKSLWETAKPILQKLGEAFKKIIDALRPVVEFTVKIVVARIQALLSILPKIIAAVQNVVNYVTNIIKAFTALFKGDFDGFKTYLKTALQNVFDFFKNIFSAIFTYVINFFNNMGVDIVSFFKDLWKKITDAFKNVGQWFADKFTEAYKGITKVFAAIGGWFKARWEDIKAPFVAVGTWFSDKFTQAYESITSVFSAVGTWFSDRWNEIMEVFSPVTSWFRDNFQIAYNNITIIFAFIGNWFAERWEEIKAALAAVGEWFKEKFNAAWQAIVQIFTPIGQWFTARWQDVKNALAAVATWFNDKFQAAWQAIVQIFTPIGQWFADRWQDIQNALSAIATWFQTMFQNAWNNITNIFSSIGSWFAARWKDIKNVFSDVATFFKTQFDNAWTNIKDAFSNVGQFFSDLWNTIVTKFTDVGVKIGEAVSGAFKATVNGVFQTIENIINGFLGAINGVIGALRKIPGLGGLTEFTLLSLPRLAKGGVLHEGQAIMAEAGPELITVSNGRAIVTPLTRGAKNTAVGTAGGAPGGGVHYEPHFHSPENIDAYKAYRLGKRGTRDLIRKLNKGRV